MTIARKLALLVLSALLGIAVMTAWFLASERKLILEERQTGVRQVVESAHGIAAHFHDLSTKGGMPEDEARKRAAAAIQAVRYSGNEYLWINDMHPRMVMHPIRPELNGQDLTGWKHVGPGDMVVEDGMIHGQGGMGLLYWTCEKLGNCVIHVEWKMRDENSNSGIFICTGKIKHRTVCVCSAVI